MIVANNLSGLTKVFLGNESIAQVYYGSNLVWPIEPSSIPMKLIFTTYMDEEISLGCTHQGTILPNTSTPQPNYVLTNSEVLDLCYDNGANEKIFTSITIGDCVTNISNSAFKLNNIFVGKNFQSLKNIKEITIGNSVTEIGEESFYPVDGTYWENLTGITLSNNLQTIGKNAFFGRRSVRNFVFPNSLVTIGEGAFSDCVSANFYFNSSIKTIGKSAFSNCESMQNITIPNSTTSLGEAAFQNCIGATVLSIGSGLKTINSNTFANCISLNRIDVPDNVLYIKDTVFDVCTSASAATIGSGCKEIGNGLFNGCKNLQNVVFANGSETSTIGNYTFNECRKLTSVTFSNTLYTIGDYTFKGCMELTEVVYPDSIYSIGIQQFYDNYSVKSITIGSGCRIIGGNDVIFRCTSYTCKAVVPPMLNGSLVFGEGVDYKIYVPSESVENYKAANGWSNYADHIFPITE